MWVNFPASRNTSKFRGIPCVSGDEPEQEIKKMYDLLYFPYKQDNTNLLTNQPNIVSVWMDKREAYL